MKVWGSIKIKPASSNWIESLEWVEVWDYLYWNCNENILPNFAGIKMGKMRLLLVKMLWPG